MALSRDARELAAEIRTHYWGDAPFRVDRAGHHREDDRGWEHKEKLDDSGAASVRANVVMVAIQVLAYRDPNLDPLEFARAAGVDGMSKDALKAGTRRDRDGNLMAPGTRWDD